MIYFKNVDEVWTSITRDDSGHWKSDGKLVTDFEVEWGENEPDNTGSKNCAAFSKAKDYKVTAVNCFDQKHYLCMAVSPKCPMGFTWLPLYGKGKSCFKVVGPITEKIDDLATQTYSDVTIADMMCHKENARIFVPENLTDLIALKDWILEPGVVDSTMVKNVLTVTS